MSFAGKREVVLHLDDALLQRFAHLATALTGMVFGENRLPDLARAVRESLWQSNLTSCTDLYDLLAGAPNDHPATRTFISHLTIGETHFFRNQPQFAALAQKILPEIIERRRSQRRLRIWSAACATGEEPYSLAILLDALLPDYESWDVSILGTDIDRQALERAERAVYGAWSFRQTSEAIRARYFEQQGRFFVLDPAIRRRVTFAHLNLVQADYPSTLTDTTEMDLILCRNAMIYFAPLTTQAIADRLFDTLSDDGWLLVGHAEPSQVVFARYQTVNLQDTVAYRRMSKPETMTTRSGISDANCRPHEEQCGRDTLPQARHAQPAGAADAKAGSWSSVDRTGYCAVAATGRCSEPGAGMAEYERARELAGCGQWIDAELWIQRAIEQRPLLAEAHYLHALLLLEAGQSGAALIAARRCTYASPGHIAGHLLLAQLYRSSGDLRRTVAALSHARKLLERQPPDAMIPDADGATAGQLLALLNVQDAVTGSSRPSQAPAALMHAKAGMS